MRHNQVTHDALLTLVPKPPQWQIDWSAIWALWEVFPPLDTCPQDPVHHAEGDVGIHTRMVVEALVDQADWRALEEEARALLFWSAVLHDIGKPATTREEENGRITARNHARVGTQMARALLWEAGSPYHWREVLCGIVSEHLMPFFLIERETYQRLAIQLSWRCRPDFLCLHARADALGRICDDPDRVFENIELATEAFKELDCFDKPYAFANDASRVSFFEKSDRDPTYAEYADFRCKVTVMAGLPGAGKDTWIASNRGDLPVISLDNIREEIGAAPTGNQGRVIQAARERAREYLRAGQDFVWNATNISRQIRQKSLGLLRDYNAEVEIAYIEVPPDTLYSQNRNRDDAIPDKALAGLVQKLEPPQDWEAHSVLRILS